MRTEELAVARVEMRSLYIAQQCANSQANFEIFCSRQRGVYVVPDVFAFK